MTLLNKDEQSAFQKFLKEEFPHLEAGEPRRQEGGLVFSLSLKPEEVKRLRENALSQSLEIIRNRIDQFGVTEPVIVRQGADEMVVQLPGVQDPQRALDLIGKTAQLEFKLVDSDQNRDLRTLVDEAVNSGRLKTDFSRADFNQALADKIPPETKSISKRASTGKPAGSRASRCCCSKKVLITGADDQGRLGAVRRQLMSPTCPWTETHGTRVRPDHRGERQAASLAIILDEVVQSAPVIQERIGGGQAQITGSFTPEEAADLAIVLRAGALPAPVKIVQNVTVGPTLGADSIQKGPRLRPHRHRPGGGLHDLLLPLLRAGGQLRHGDQHPLSAGALSLFGATLTLPGIAGIILSIGMAVDSNVLIFERMREEFHAGKPVKAGMDGGYDKAFWTIIDSHVTTLITAVVLFLFGTGPIKGFAVTLSLGVILNLFTALFGTRVVYDYLLIKRWLKKLSFLRAFSKNPISISSAGAITPSPSPGCLPLGAGRLCAAQPGPGQPGGGVQRRHPGADERRPALHGQRGAGRLE